MTQSAELTRFYRDYLDWLNNYRPWWNTCFRRDTGLCYNLTHWCAVRQLSTSRLWDEIKAQFEAAKLSREFPFNRTPKDYLNEVETDTLHMNEERMKWVRDHATGEDNG